jgi:hypothetical protein
VAPRGRQRRPRRRPATDNGRPIPGLTASDFVLDNGVEQRLDSVVGDRNRSMLFTFDRSQHARRHAAAPARVAAALLDALTRRPGRLLTFNHMFTVPVPIGPVERVRAALPGSSPKVRLPSPRLPWRRPVGRQQPAR